MTQTARSAWLLLWAATVLGVLALNIVDPPPALDGAWPWTAGLMAFPVAAAIVLLGRPRNTIGRLLAVIASAAGVQFLIAWVTELDPTAPWVGYADAFAGSVAVGIFGGILGLLHLFPDGQPLSRTHRRFLVAGVWVLLVVAVAELFVPGTMESSGRENPMGVAPAWVKSIVDGTIVTLPIGAIAGIVVLIRRRRDAGPLERAQLRWFFVGSGTLTLMFAMFALLPDTEGTLLSRLLSVLFLLGFWSLPAAIVVAVTRYRLYDIDRILSRTVSYVIIAGALATVYALLVLAFQTVLPVDGSQIAVAASTLIAAALFAPLRRVVQQRLDHRFNRARYEARLVTQEFGRRLQREIDPTVIQHDLERVITQTMEPVAVRVWLRS